MTSKEWSFGDRVMHAKRPEWGAGVVTAAQRIVHDGKPCQRVTVRFDRAGIKTLTTAMADLVPASEGFIAAALNKAEEEDRIWAEKLAGGGGGGAGGGGGGAAAAEAMTQLPEAVRDPFVSLEGRVKATLGLYRFTDQGGSLLDWAASQSGLKDPLSEFSRHDLERLFQRFAFLRDEHLKKLVLELKKKDAAALAAAIKDAPPSAHQALRRLDIGR